jgi:hypothetical protein
MLDTRFLILGTVFAVADGEEIAHVDFFSQLRPEGAKKF